MDINLKTFKIEISQFEGMKQYMLTKLEKA
jgi:hypothetical protein